MKEVVEKHVAVKESESLNTNWLDLKGSLDMALGLASQASEAGF